MKWITTFHAIVSFLYPQKTFGFLTFSEGIEVGPWREKDLYHYSTKKFFEISAENNF